MKRIIILLVFCISCFSSCIITQEFTVNSDLTARQETTVDLSQLMAILGDNDTLSLQIDSIFSANKEKYSDNDSLGYKDVEFKHLENGILKLSYNIPNFEKYKDGMQVSVKDKKITIELGDIAKYFEQLKSEQYDFQSTSELFQYYLIFNFDKKIKDVDGDNVGSFEIINGGKTLKFGTTLNQFPSKAITINFK
ncbi:MAG: hypothetical protein MJ211_15900 [Bacteroidales bacterium]|nr:hypothetical protein [Bacteroidales bacterium]